MSPIKAVQVKICGLTNVEDARWAVNLGADYVGVNFCAESPRKVSPEMAAEIVASVPSFVKTVGVFVDPDMKELDKILKKVQLHVLQLHGEESAETLFHIQAAFKLPIWKAVRVQKEESLSRLEELKGLVNAVLLDGYQPGQPGGTGQTFDWALAAKAKPSGIPIFLAGGLTPENVLAAIEAVEPLGVDAASGVEKEGHPREKDANKMKLFISKAKGLMK